VADPAVVLWDIGGVLLSNGWEAADRVRAAQTFGFDAAEVERRHLSEVPSFERGEISMVEYLDRTLFYTPRSFSRGSIESFMYDCTTAHPAVLELARELGARHRFLMASFNNESRELNERRIARFGLRDFLSVFFSSCYIGRRKPDPAAYRLVLDCLQRPASELVFIDDRPENLVPAADLGMRTIHYQTPEALRVDLAREGVVA
jgi:putative hydrolase of the HAD superfamily